MIRNRLIITILSATIPLLAQEKSQEQSQAQEQPASSEKSQQELKVSEQDMKQQVTDANKATKLIGMQVKNKQDEDLGKIKDLVVDFQSGKIAYAVLSSGGPFGIGGKLGIGGKMVAVPIQALTLQPGAKNVVIDLPKQQLGQAQGFSEQNWPDLNAAEKGQTIGLSSTAQGAAGSQSQQSTESKGSEQQDEKK